MIHKATKTHTEKNSGYIVNVCSNGAIDSKQLGRTRQLKKCLHELLVIQSNLVCYDDYDHDDDIHDHVNDDDDDDDDDYQLINCDLKIKLRPQLIPINQLSRPTETSERLISIHFNDDDDIHDHFNDDDDDHHHHQLIQRRQKN